MQPIKTKFTFDKFLSNEFKSIIDDIKNKCIKSVPTSEITEDYFIMYCLENTETMLYKVLNSYLNTIIISSIHDKIQQDINDKNINVIINNDLSFSTNFTECITRANDLRITLNHKFVTSDHILLVLLSGASSNKQSKKYFELEGLNYSTYLTESIKIHDAIDEFNQPQEQTSIQPQNGTVIKVIGDPSVMSNLDFSKLLGLNQSQQNNNSLKKSGVSFCRNLNHEAKIGKIDNLIGRDKEINNILKVMARRKCNNIALIGNTGVGKTAIIEGLAKRIEEKTCPLILNEWEIYAMNVGELMGGTNLRGMFEERVNRVMSDLKSKKNAILFIDDIHVISGEKRGEDYDFLGLISNQMNNGDVNIIISTTYKGYKTFSNGNPDMAKKFYCINVDPMSYNDTIEILNSNKHYYEEYHNVIYNDDVIKTCVELSDKFITDSSLPSSAIAIMDEVGANKKISFTNSTELMDKIRNLKELEEIKDGFIRADKIEESNNVNQQIKTIKNEIVNGFESLKNISEEVKTITVNDVYEAVAEHTNIPISKVSKTDKENLAHISDLMKSVIVGQDEAIEAITRSIKRNKLGLGKPNRPIYSCIAIGETGVGKTLMAKTLAKEIFGDEKYLVRFDMSEYSDKTSVNKLIGSSAGYIGYDKGGLLTEAIKNKRYAVLLIDEIEKATDEIFNLFLQILDEGFLTDNMGNKVDFKNTIIIMTSNVGAKRASSEKAMGFNPDSDLNKKDIINDELKKKFSPEFINRLDDVIYFNSLTNDNLLEIIKIEIKQLNERLNNINMSLECNEKVYKYLLSLIEKDKEYGARPISRIVQKEIENKITDLLIENDYETHIFNVSVNENNLLIK